MARVVNLPSTVCAQGARSDTFTPPPDDTYLSLSEVYDWHFEHSALHPFFVYHDDVSDVKVTIQWKDAVQAIYRIANSVSLNLGDRGKADDKPLVGLYSSSGTLIYLLSLIGVLRAGFPVFLISNRMSPAALKHLIAKSGASHILTDEGDVQLATRLEDARNGLEGSKSFTISYIPSWNQLFSPSFTVEKPLPVQPNLEDLCLILHSSGSTALPELNSWTHRMVHTALWIPWYGEKDICGHVFAGPSIPMGGAAGVMQALFPASGGLVLSGLKPQSPPIMPTPDNVWKSLVATQSTYAFILQPFLAIWSEDPSKIPILAGLEGVGFGGGPLMKPVGDKLAEQGVNIFNFFGSSESGLMNMVFPGKRSKEWEYMSFYSLISPGFRPDGEDGTVELIIKSCPTHVPTKFNTTFDGTPAYATGDLLQPHPIVPGLWKYLCRVADQETIGPGLGKVNAVALARILMTDPNVAGAVLVNMNVGSSIAFGAVIEPSAAASSTQAEAYINLIWPTVERYNEIAPIPTRLTKQRIIIASKSKPFGYGEKGMPRRKDVIKDYNDELAKLV